MMHTTLHYVSLLSDIGQSDSRAQPDQCKNTIEQNINKKKRTDSKEKLQKQMNYSKAQQSKELTFASFEGKLKSNKSN